jgi:hypothetical protein
MSSGWCVVGIGRSRRWCATGGCHVRWFSRGNGAD